MERRKRSGGLWRGLLTIVILAAAGGFAWQYARGEKEASYEIQTVELSRGSIERSISATGSVQALVTSMRESAGAGRPLGGDPAPAAARDPTRAWLVAAG